MFEQDRLFGIYAAGDQGRCVLANGGGELGGVVIDGDRVQIGEEDQALGLVLHLRPALDRAEIIAEMRIARRLDSGNDAYQAAAFRLLSMFNFSRSTAPMRNAVPK